MNKKPLSWKKFIKLRMEIGAAEEKKQGRFSLYFNEEANESLLLKLCKVS